MRNLGKAVISINSYLILKSGRQWAKPNGGQLSPQNLNKIFHLDLQGYAFNISSSGNPAEGWKRESG